MTGYSDTEVYFEVSRCDGCGPLVPGYPDRWMDCNVCLGNAGYNLRKGIEALWGNVGRLALIRVGDASGKYIKRFNITKHLLENVLDAVNGVSISRMGNRIVVMGKNNEMYELVPCTGQRGIR
jgi:hypothetical protein